MSVVVLVSVFRASGGIPSGPAAFPFFKGVDTPEKMRNIIFLTSNVFHNLKEAVIILVYHTL